MATKKRTQQKSGAKKRSGGSGAKRSPSPATGEKKAKARPAKKAPAKKTGTALAQPGGRPVHTGKGPAPLDVGRSLVELARAGRGAEVERKWWAPGVVSVEGLGVSMEWVGSRAAHRKGADWEADHVVHGVEIEGPFVGASGFAVRFKMDIETKSTGQREKMEEVGVYTVKDGKIVREEFMYRAG
jgi:hypothetical protein